MERGRHGRGLRLTFPYRGLQTRTARRTAQGGADCRGGEDGAGRRGLQRWGSRAAADRNGTADGAGRRGGRPDEQEARLRMDWERRRLSIGKVAAVAVAPARAPIFPAARDSFPPAFAPRRAPILPPLPAFAPVGTARTIFDRLRARF